MEVVIMKKLSAEQRRQLQSKINNERERRHEAVMEIARGMDESGERSAFGYRSGRPSISYHIIRPLIMRIPGLSYRGKLIVGALVTLILSVIAIALAILILGGDSGSTP
jgi:hypothetical protein